MRNLNYKTIAALIFLLFALQIKAQKGINTIVQKQYNRYFGMEADYQGGSNSLNNNIMRIVAFGGFVDDDLKNTNLDRMKNLNVYGSSADFKLYYRQENMNFRGMQGMGFQMALEWHSLQEIHFGKELYRLIFYGNKSTAGSAVDLSATAFNALNYYQLKVGLNKTSKNKRSNYGFNAALNLGNNYKAGTFDNAEFYTSPNGDSIALSGNINYLYGDLNGTPPFDINGLGAAIDLFYLYDNPSLFKLSFKVLNLGFIKWKKKAERFQQNETIVWEGLEVANLLKMPDPLFEKSGIDSLKEYIESKGESATFSSFTPAYIKTSISRFFNENKIEGILKFDYRLFSFYRPMVLIQTNFLLNENIIIAPNISYGGWSNFNFGFEFQYKIKDYGKLKLGTKYLGGYMFQNNFGGFGGFITFTYQI